MKIQNAYGTKNKREKELAKVNRNMSKHFEDTFDTRDVLINGIPKKLMIIRDTDSNVYKKKIKAKHDDVFNLGDYVVWKNQVWLITLIDTDDDTWNRGYMYLCGILLRWQNDKGEIIERWGYSEDFTKYSSGVEEGKVVNLGFNQYGLTLPVDDETKILKRDKRFAIDIDGVDPPDVYKLTNKKALLNDNSYFGRGGVLNLTLSYKEFNKDTDKKVKLPDGKEVWICNYIPPEKHLLSDKNDILISINGRDDLPSGYKRIYTITCTDEDGNAVATPTDFAWNVVCDFDDVLETEISGDTITLFIDDDDYVDEKFRLQALAGGVVKNEKIVAITGIHG